MAVTCDAGNRLFSRKVGDMDESVIEGGIDMGNSEHELALADLGAQLDGGFLCNTCLFGRLQSKGQ
jgi:hypothetical protein